MSIVLTGCFNWFLAQDTEAALKEVKMQNRFNRKTKKRQRFLDNVRKAHKKKVNKEKSDPTKYSFSALHLVHDPQASRHLYLFS